MNKQDELVARLQEAFNTFPVINDSPVELFELAINELKRKDAVIERLGDTKRISSQGGAGHLGSWKGFDYYLEFTARTQYACDNRYPK